MDYISHIVPAGAVVDDVIESILTGKKNDTFAKKSIYKDIVFRSTLEARWAVFFDCLDVQWVYEPELQHIDGINYLPDFWLPDYAAYIEIKPSSNQTRINKAAALATRSTVAVVLNNPQPSPLVYFGFPGRQLLQNRGAFGFCINCYRLLMCVRSEDQHGKTIYLPALIPNNECRHKFLSVDSVTAIKRAKFECAIAHACARVD